MKIGVMLRHFGQVGGIGVYTVNVINALFRVDQKNQYVLIYNRPEHLGKFSHFLNVIEKVVRIPSKLFWDQISIPIFAKREGLDT